MFIGEEMKKSDLFLLVQLTGGILTVFDILRPFSNIIGIIGFFPVIYYLSKGE